MLRGMPPLALVTFGVFALCGQGIARSGASVLLGTAFALLLFYMICRSTVRGNRLSAGTGHSHYAARLCSSLHAHGGVRYRGDQAAVSERSSGHPAVFSPRRCSSGATQFSGKEVKRLNVEINGPKILGYLFGNTNLPITETMRNSWIIMAFILFLCIFFNTPHAEDPKKASRHWPKRRC